jgi:hypothetical protein
VLGDVGSPSSWNLQFKIRWNRTHDMSWPAEAVPE